MDYITDKKIAVLDFGGQYAHLIASRIRRLGAFSEIVSPDDFTPEQAEKYSGIVYSGGPSSVYEANAPVSDPNLLKSKKPLLGICYGHQLIMHQLGGKVQESKGREYGPARLNIVSNKSIFTGEKSGDTVWMSHGDEVIELPENFIVLASTPDCINTAVWNSELKITGLQFHPEVNDTVNGDKYLLHFIAQCGISNSYSLDDFLEQEINRIREQVRDNKVFLMISGGVDSTVAFAMLAKALPHDRLLGLFVDTGFMRKNEMMEVREALRELGVNLQVEDASSLYFEKLSQVADPEKKRNIIGELFLDVQKNVTERLGLNPDEWFLGQGTIYPDTIESGATKNSHTIKTHHNRVERIQKMLESGHIVEPLRDLYKDEVRRLGRLLGLSESLVMRHPFPGPGLAVRTLCTDSHEPSPVDLPMIDLESLKIRLKEFFLLPEVLPVRSVGVQGDKRSYAHPLVLIPEGKMPEYKDLFELSSSIPNRFRDINRVLYLSGRKSSDREVSFQYLRNRYLTVDRIELLRKADLIVHEFQIQKKLYGNIWQFPVVLAPVSDGINGESIILRPVRSQDAMTASCFPLEEEILLDLSKKIIDSTGSSYVFLDITSKPPGTIEWE